MILCKKPCVLYDVDGIGIGVLTLLGAAAYLIGIAPLQVQQSALREVRSEWTTARAATQEAGDRLAQVHRDLEQLKTYLTAGVAEAPTTASLTPFLSHVAALAGEANLQLLQVVPAPTKTTGDHITSDIRMSGRGGSLDFIRFLDRLSRANQYQTLQAVSITRAKGAAGATCGLSWTLRLHMLPEDFPALTGGAS